ncbi:MAG: hypothetical protein BMS9Abin26_0304 [Gammaproteobacteria bacterium]|nr:MAG: hypothetical protein BMS9Abin26_0304 [Gammaproteobacteria bacterium]
MLFFRKYLRSKSSTTEDTEDTEDTEIFTLLFYLLNIIYCEKFNMRKEER